MKVRVTKQFTFEAAHALDNYDGKCCDIHGHSYHLEITVIGQPKSNTALSDCGMVIDFSAVKMLLKSEVLPLFDHRLILRKDSRFAGIEVKNQRVRYVDYQPTCENMLLDIVHLIKDKFPTGIALTKVVLRETSTSYATWYRSDNE
ncbi:MAG: 6-carboxytetrahydropterin synthase [Bacteroidetes bacterium]|nr:6-carboxytetrahydropterin synthase [Bacteroidota bacterium]